MDQFQNPEPNPTTSLFQMNLDAQNSYNLRSAASWAKVLGVVGIIMGVIFVILTVVGISNRGSSSYRYRRGGFGNLFSGQDGEVGIWIMTITGIIFIVGGIFSFSFGNKINAALKSNDQNGLNAGFSALRNYFALRSITIIIVLLFLLLTLTSSI